jgi:biopolymer transport protein ExbD
VRVRRANEEEVTMNMAPLIDVVFQMLIFFMVATTYGNQTMEKELDVDLPTAESGEEPAKREEVVINLLRDGRIVVDGANHTRESLLRLLEEVARADAQTPVTIRGDKQSMLESVVSIMDVCRITGLSNLGVMTRDS